MFKIQINWEKEIPIMSIVSVDDGKAISICNFRRYGWCYSSGVDADAHYSGIIFANGDGLFDIKRTISTRAYLHIQFARMVEKIDSNKKLFGNFSAVFKSKKFQDQAEKLIDEAVKHPQEIIGRKDSIYEDRITVQ